MSQTINEKKEGKQLFCQCQEDGQEVRIDQVELDQDFRPGWNPNYSASWIPIWLNSQLTSASAHPPSGLSNSTIFHFREKTSRFM